METPRLVKSESSARVCQWRCGLQPGAAPPLIQVGSLQPAVDRHPLAVALELERAGGFDREQAFQWTPQPDLATALVDQEDLAQWCMTEDDTSFRD